MDSTLAHPLSDEHRVHFERHALPNGLRIVLHRDTTLPLVAVNLWYHVGSKLEQPGSTGYAHLLEHLMFQGSQNVGTNDHFRLVQKVGGTANGSTWYDRTNYYEVLPSHHLDLGLWLESDRMGHFLPSVTQEKLDNQREVVINERRQKIDNQPYGRGFERLHELLYGPAHPYRWPVIGYIEDLEQATLDTVCNFFERFYTPANAVLTLAGDFEVDDALERIDRWFGDIPTAERPAPLNPAPPQLDGEIREVLEDDIRLPRIYLGYNAPPFGDQGWYTGDLLATAFSDGKSSLLYEDLVYRRQLAQDVGCYILPTETTATFAVVSTAKPGVDPAELESALDEHLERAGESLEEHRVERAKQRLLTNHHDHLQLLDRRADFLSHYTTFLDDPDRINNEPSMYQKLTAGDTSTFARNVLRRDRRVSLTLVPRATDSTETPRGDKA